MIKTSNFTIDIPHFYCHVKAEYLYNLESHYGEFIPCLVFGADSIYGRAIGFDIVTDFGGMFARLPISALVHKIDAPEIPLDWLQLWNNFSYNFEAHEYSAIRGADCEVILQDNNWYPGIYKFTFSWYGNNYAEDPGEGGFKRAHLIQLDNGTYCLTPNNRVKWYEQSFITKEFPKNPDFKTNEHIWTVENYKTEDSDLYYYNVRERNE